MSRRASPLAIGTFIVVGAGVLVVALLALGSSAVFRDTTDFVVYLRGDVNGLYVGAPVKFKGIPVGSVEDLRVTVFPPIDSAADVRVRARIRIEQQRVSAAEGAVIDLDDPAQVRALVDRGLRASLALENLVTGQRYVNLDIVPGAPVDRVAAAPGGPMQIPVVPGWGDQFQEDASRLAARLADADLEGLLASTRALIDETRALVASPDLRRALARLDDVTADLDTTLASARQVIGAYGADGAIGGDVEAAANEAQAALSSLRRLVRPDGGFAGELEETLAEVQDAARSLRVLADRLARDPGALIRGAQR